MPVGFVWSTGVHEELAAIEELFNHDLPDGDATYRSALQRFETQMTTPLGTDGAAGLMDAVGELLAVVNEQRRAQGVAPLTVRIDDDTRADLAPPMLEGIHRDWFTEACMWRFDATRSPEQMHEIMRLTGAEMARRRLAGGGPVAMLAQCEHDEMRVRFARGPNDDRAYRVWVYTPANAGWLSEGALPNDVIIQELQQLAQRYDPDDLDDPTRDRLLNDIVAIVNRASMTLLPYQDEGVPFHFGGGFERPVEKAGSAVPQTVPSGTREPGVSQPPSEADQPSGDGTVDLEIRWIPSGQQAE